MIKIVALLLISYLIGSIPNAYLYCKIRGKDIRKEGSQNVGATNAARLFGPVAFFIVFILDAIKGFIPVFFLVPLFIKGESNIELIKVMCLLSVTFGHIWTIFLNFKGGKGVATSTGGLLALMPYACFLSLFVFLLVFALTRIVSLGSILAAVLLPIFSIVTTRSYIHLSLSILLAILIVFTHRTNIIRLINGTESKFKKKSTENKKD